MKYVMISILFTAIFMQLQGCASTGASANPAYETNMNAGVPSNMNYIYRSPPPQVTRALSGR